MSQPGIVEFYEIGNVEMEHILLRIKATNETEIEFTGMDFKSL
jgi:hypothetical protein